MKESESYRNLGLEELMNYLSSLTKMESNTSYDEPSHQIMPADKNEDAKNWALEELMNYVSSLTEMESNTNYTDSPKRVIGIQNKLVEVGAIAREKKDIALSLSNLTNLIALIKELHLSNGNLVKQVTYLNRAITEFHQELENCKAQFSEAKSKLNAQDRELAASNQTIQEQQNVIEKLKMELGVYKELVVQVQADYNEQSYQLSAEKDNCRDLRTRLNREQQHSLQLKVALEKCLEVPTASYQLADDRPASYINNLEDSDAHLAPKTPPIKPWTTQPKCGSNQIDLAWERQECQSNATSSEETSDRLPVEAENDIICVDYVEVFNGSVTADEVEDAIAPTDDYDDYDVQVASPIEPNRANPRVKSPSPLVYPSRPPKGRKSLAAIELPSFIS